MKNWQSYSFVGPKEILGRVSRLYEGRIVAKVKDVVGWINENSEMLVNGDIIATFVISEQGTLLLNDRHSEHVICAGGRNVLSAGEITFSFEKGAVFVSGISNQSTGYCPKPESWEAVGLALDEIGLEHPGYFTEAFEFRYCEKCQTKNLIKEKVYECAVCESDLDLEWNIDKMK